MPGSRTFEDLPGGTIVSEGLADLAEGREDTVPALLVQVARTSLGRLGIPVPGRSPGIDPGLLLYRAIGRDFPADAHSRTQAHLEQLSSFLSALERKVFTAP